MPDRSPSLPVRRSLRTIAALLLGTALTGLALPSAVADQGQRIDYTFGAPTRTVIDNGAPGTSVGDVTITTGDVLAPRSGKRLGYYTTNQITVRADATTKRQIRKVDLSIVLRDGTIYATSVIRAAEGAPPTQRMTFAVIGGTGAYDGASGTLVHEAVANRPAFAVTIDLLPQP